MKRKEGVVEADPSPRWKAQTSFTADVNSVRAVLIWGKEIHAKTVKKMERF